MHVRVNALRLSLVFLFSSSSFFGFACFFWGGQTVVALRVSYLGFTLRARFAAFRFGGNRYKTNAALLIANVIKPMFVYQYGGRRYTTCVLVVF